MYVLQLMKAYKVLDTALHCLKLADSRQLSKIDMVVSCAELVARDLRNLFRLFHAKLMWVLIEEQQGDLFLGWEKDDVHSVLTIFKNFYNDKLVT